MLRDAKKGQRVVKVVDIHGIATATIQPIVKVSKIKGLVYMDASNIDDEGVSTYRMDNGRPVHPNSTYPALARIIPITES